MRIGWRDGVATLLVAAIVVPYIGYLVRGSMPFIQDPRGMAATALVLGIAAAAVVGREAFRGTWGVAAGFFAVASAVLGVVTFIRAEGGALSEDCSLSSSARSSWRGRWQNWSAPSW